ncbi:LysE family transporter [Mesorhizobium sp. STM 4661]|uniref:LysE family translocator n=1 Tax=Mesorhizobium sp. STM 4661 TaxID=1297570 RepID=UPI001FCB2294|nr:LysE family transporter [Mesorhizobium sp. STM 4661]
MITITPGPIGLATGSLASLHGFGRTIPLLAGIGVGTAVLATLVAFGTIHLAQSLSMPAVKIAGATVLGGMALRIARTAPPATGEAPHKRQTELFAGGFLISFLSPEAATFFAVAFLGLMLPIQNSSEVLMVAAVVAIFDIGWYGFLAIVLSRPVVRAAAMRRHRAISRAAGAVLAILALVWALSAFPST